VQTVGSTGHEGGKEVWASVPGPSDGCMLAGPRWPARAVGWPVQCLQGHVLAAVEAGPAEICCGVRLGEVGLEGEEWRRQEGGRCILLSNTEMRKLVTAASRAGLDDA
jgi:hypothetical protein